MRHRVGPRPFLAGIGLWPRRFFGVATIRYFGFSGPLVMGAGSCWRRLEARSVGHYRGNARGSSANPGIVSWGGSAQRNPPCASHGQMVGAAPLTHTTRSKVYYGVIIGESLANSGILCGISQRIAPNQGEYPPHSCEIARFPGAPGVPNPRAGRGIPGTRRVRPVAPLRQSTPTRSASEGFSPKNPRSRVGLVWRPVRPV